MHLAAVLDAEATRAGMGDAGGVATLLSRLGAELARQPGIANVISIGRAVDRLHGGSVPDLPGVVRGHRFEAIALEEGEGATFSGSWPSLVAARRAIRAIFLALGSPDVIHLRMADPGSLAAMTVARQLGIPTVFTLAPDPHGPIATAERAGTLDRRNFAIQDEQGALWYRATLVSELARSARKVVLFPRPDLHREMRDLLGVDLSVGSLPHTIVAEGVDMRLADTASIAVRRREEAPVLSDLRLAIARLPFERQGLPIVVSVGRLHAIKGMARVVEAFARDLHLAASANLVIIGGDLEHPGAAEAAELARIHALMEAHRDLRDRVVLLGHRPHADASLVLAAARFGWGRGIAPCGAYVCGSLKEEFGLAIVEAMAAGLPVVAPVHGGPASYVEPGRTGALVDTTDAAAIAVAVREALAMARDPETAARSREVVERLFTLDRMARTLAAVYRRAAGVSSLALPVEEGQAA